MMREFVSQTVENVTTENFNAAQYGPRWSEPDGNSIGR
jgi:hypothetical protein